MGGQAVSTAPSGDSALLRVALRSLAAGVHELEPDAAHYVVRVHRLRAGDRFTAFDPAAGVEADAELVEVGRRRTTCSLSSPRPASAVSDLSVTLLQALGKGDKLEQVIAGATALGVTRIVAVRTERTVVTRDALSEARARRWSKAAVEAARQSGRGDVPAIVGPASFEAALALADPGAVRLCLHPGGERTLHDGLAGWSGSAPLALLIGPEGGFSPGEIEVAGGAGFVAVRLGPFVLRSELAAVACLGAVVASARSRRS